MNNIEITNSLFEAVNIIVNEVIRNLPYDRTLIATITDNKKKDYGIYQVITRKGSTFTTYSDNSNYNVNDQVYVLIPNGDYSEKKFILSKYITGSELLELSNLPLKDKGWEPFLKGENNATIDNNVKKLQLQLILRYKELEPPLPPGVSRAAVVDPEVSKLNDLCESEFGIDIWHFEEYLKDVYGEDYLKDLYEEESSIDISAAVRQYLAEHPEIIQAAVDEYLETKE